MAQLEFRTISQQQQFHLEQLGSSSSEPPTFLSSLSIYFTGTSLSLITKWGQKGKIMRRLSFPLWCAVGCHSNSEVFSFLFFFSPQETKLLFFHVLDSVSLGLLLIMNKAGCLLTNCSWQACVQLLIRRGLSLPARFAAYINCNL